MTQRLTALIEPEDTGYVALCPELDIASQGDSVDEAHNNLREAVEVFFEAAPAEEVDRRIHYQDNLDYEERLKILEELTAQAQELGMGYE